MGKNTAIEWAHHTLNPWLGCTKVSAGCDHCYAESMMDRRLGRVSWGAGNPRSRTTEKNWQQPLHWDRAAYEREVRERVFCSSLADVFDGEVDQAWRDDLWALIAQTTNLDWLLLTKRPNNVRRMVPPSWLQGEWPASVWLGVSVENQAAANSRIPELCNLPAPRRFLSCEPLLGPVDIRNGALGNAYSTPTALDADGYGVEWTDPGDAFIGIDWVIVGGESGKDARPMHPEWATSLRDQCQESRVSFLFKQWGEYRPATREDATATHAQLVPIRPTSWNRWRTTDELPRLQRPTTHHVETVAPKRLFLAHPLARLHRLRWHRARESP